MKLTGKYLAASDWHRHAFRADHVNGTDRYQQGTEWAAACLAASGWPASIVKRKGHDGTDVTAVAIVNREHGAEEVWARIVVNVNGKPGYWWVPIPPAVPALPPPVWGMIVDHGQDLDATDEIELFDGE